MKLERPVIAIVFMLLGAGAMLVLSRVGWTGAPIDPPLECDRCHDALAEMGALREAILELSRSRPAVASDIAREEASSSSDPLGDVDELRTRLDELGMSVESLIAEVRTYSRSIETPPAEIPMNRAAVASAIVTARNDREQDKATSFFGWSPLAIYRRFGAAMSVGTSGQSTIIWYYRLDQNERIGFVFRGGIVVDITFL